MSGLIVLAIVGALACALFVYCALVLASDADDAMDRMAQALLDKDRRSGT